MINKFQVIDERVDIRADQSRHVILTLADTSRPALAMTLDYEPKGDDLTKLPPEGKRTDIHVDLAMKNLRWNNFQSRMEVQGPVINVELNGSVSPKPVGK